MCKEHRDVIGSICAQREKLAHDFPRCALLSPIKKTHNSHRLESQHSTFLIVRTSGNRATHPSVGSGEPFFSGASESGN